MPATFLPLALLRIIGGLGLLVGVGAFGYFARPLLVLPVLAVIFTISFGLGKWRAWAHAAQTGGLGKAIIGQVGTYVIQLILVAILYFIGRGIGSMVGVAATSPTLGQSDWVWLGWFAVFAMTVGVGIVVLDLRARTGIEEPGAMSGLNHEPDAPELDPVPLTLATFWNGHHYSNKDRVYDDSHETVLNEERAFLSETGIEAEEARLGVVLPTLVRSLYTLQNGGGALRLYVPCARSMANAEGGWINPFSGYDEMTPLTRVVTLQESISAYAYEDDQPEMFPRDSAQMIILAQWYRETLFLDYRGRETPRVGFADFDNFDDLSSDAWEDDALWWENFDAFFAELRAEVDR